MKLKKLLGASILTGAMLFNTASAATTSATSADRETVYQVALLQSLALGHFDGNITVRDLKKFGDIGIGTFKGLNGEMIVLNGVVYQALQNCNVQVADDKTTVPFSNVTFFERDFSVKLNNVADKSALESILNEAVEKHGKNSFYMIKLPATFNEIIIRSELGQSKPYPTLVQALQATQHEETLQNVSGTIVGLYCPNYMSELNTVGWHFHFISDDKTTGGHVLNMNIRSGEAQLDKTDGFKMQLPDKKDFQSLNLAADLREDIRKAENDSTKGD